MSDEQEKTTAPSGGGEESLVRLWEIEARLARTGTLVARRDGLESISDQYRADLEWLIEQLRAARQSSSPHPRKAAVEVADPSPRQQETPVLDVLRSRSMDSQTPAREPDAWYHLEKMRGAINEPAETEALPTLDVLREWVENYGTEAFFSVTATDGGAKRQAAKKKLLAAIATLHARASRGAL